MQGTIGVPDDLKLDDLLADIKRFQEEHTEEQLKVLRTLYKMQRRKLE